MRIVWRRLARDDLDRQFEWIAKDRPRAAAAMRERVITAIDLLEAWPLLGRRSRKGFRELPVARSPFIVIYRVEETEIVIVRVMHGAQKR
jgi:toxin ParE1/3/4